MSPYRAFKRALWLIIFSAALALGTAALIWVVAANVGIRLPFPTVLAAVGVVVIWSVVSSGRTDPPPPTPPMGPPRVPPTWADAERMAALHKAGLLSRQEVDRVLRELVPPEPRVPPGQRGSRK